jgi:hypothetical protein
LEKGTHVHWEPRVFWEDTRQPVERGSECRATYSYTLATALTPLPRWRGLPRESPLPVHVYVRTYCHWYNVSKPTIAIGILSILESHTRVPVLYVHRTTEQTNWRLSPQFIFVRDNNHSTAILVFRIRSKSPLVSEIQHRCSSLWNYYGAVSRWPEDSATFATDAKNQKNHAVVVILQ